MKKEDFSDIRMIVKNSFKLADNEIYAAVELGPLNTCKHAKVYMSMHYFFLSSYGNIVAMAWQDPSVKCVCASQGYREGLYDHPYTREHIRKFARMIGKNEIYHYALGKEVIKN